MTLLEDRRDTAEAPDQAEAVICVQDLRLGPSYRAAGIDPDHVRALQETAGAWPPIVVARSAGTVVDGLHRVHAALALGIGALPCLFFDGDDDAAYAEFVRCNTSHGKPLTFAERQAAANRLLGTHQEWSDRRIAATCALSPASVARLRETARPRASDPRGRLDVRVGRDGRQRPLDARLTRACIAEAIRADPKLSLREVAALVGASPSTVRSVRIQLAEQLPGVGEPVAAATLSLLEEGDVTSEPWLPDGAILSTDEGSEFAEWFSRTTVGEAWRKHVFTVPYSRIYDVADEARRRAAQWTEFARALEGRSHRRQRQGRPVR
jgi:ParB-like chromosome segregation protein Spo0J